MSTKRLDIIMVILSFFIALMLLIFPLPEKIAPFRPQFAMLVLVYWVFTFPERIGVATGWIVGLLMDVLVGGVLGEYALCMALIAYFTYELQTRLRMFPMIQQMLTVCVLVGGSQILVAWANYLAGDTYRFNFHWQPILTTTLCWPLVYLVMSRES